MQLPRRDSPRLPPTSTGPRDGARPQCGHSAGICVRGRLPLGSAAADARDHRGYCFDSSHRSEQYVPEQDSETAHTNLAPPCSDLCRPSQCVARSIHRPGRASARVPRPAETRSSRPRTSLRCEAQTLGADGRCWGRDYLACRAEHAAVRFRSTREPPKGVRQPLVEVVPSLGHGVSRNTLLCDCDQTVLTAIASIQSPF